MTGTVIIILTNFERAADWAPALHCCSQTAEVAARTWDQHLDMDLDTTSMQFILQPTAVVNMIVKVDSTFTVYCNIFVSQYDR